MKKLVFAAVLAAAMPALAATVTAGIESAVRISGSGWSGADGTFTIANPPVNLASLSANQPRIWFERRLLVPDLSYGGTPVGGVLVDWLKDSESLGVPYAQLPGGAPLLPNASFAPLLRRVDAGTPVDSYYFYSNRNNFNLVNNPSYSGSIVFRLPILGVITRNGPLTENKLNTTNSDFGRPGVSGYPTANNAGHDVTPFDRFSVEQVSNGWKLDFRITNNGFDNFRILTATPEPAAWAAFGLAASVLVVAARRRRLRSPER